MAREVREQRQAEIFPLAPTNTTRTRSVRGTHLAERNFRVCQHLLTRTKCCLSWGILRGERASATPSQGRRAYDITNQRIAL